MILHFEIYNIVLLEKIKTSLVRITYRRSVQPFSKVSRIPARQFRASFCIRFATSDNIISPKSGSISHWKLYCSYDALVYIKINHKKSIYHTKFSIVLFSGEYNALCRNDNKTSMTPEMWKRALINHFKAKHLLRGFVIHVKKIPGNVQRGAKAYFKWRGDG